MHRSYDVEDAGQCFVFVLDLRTKSKVRNANASPPKPLDVATSNFADALVTPKVAICDGVPSAEV